MHTFIADYPTEKNIKDGMMIRIKEIDEKFVSQNRQYIDIRFFDNFNANPVVENPTSNCTVYHYNYFKHWFKINKLLSQSKSVYSHTLYNFIKVMFQLQLWFPSIPVAHDIHGVIPEELDFQGSKKQSLVYSWVEKMAFKRVNYFVHVTGVMKKHFHEKYKKLYAKRNITDVTYGIITSINDANLDSKKIEQAKQQLSLSSQSILFIYSGGLQKWQNVSIMIDGITRLLQTNSHYKFAIFTGDVAGVKQLLSQHGLVDSVFVDSVTPDELRYYYSIANYGFVLRDDHILNRVANPTKLSEYLAFGITPIVICKQIGDYYDMGYEYIDFDLLDKTTFIASKSSINKEIYLKYKQANELVKVPFE